MLAVPGPSTRENPARCPPNGPAHRYKEGFKAYSQSKQALRILTGALARKLEGVTGKYFEKRTEGDPKFRDPSVAAELERALSAIAARIRASA
ncbi:MAG TPA: hypothetical protein VE549_06975 [Myxococcaceae bacterium]|jgi:hypothetical protein|nr:hypothetical protein [Myxococcaceae bacterium]